MADVFVITMQESAENQETHHMSYFWTCKAVPGLYFNDEFTNVCVCGLAAAVLFNV